MSFAAFIGEKLQAFIYGVATSLLYPVLALEALALLFVIFELGHFTFEVIQRMKTKRRGAESSGPSTLVERLSAMGSSKVAAAAGRSVTRTADPSRTLLLKALADAELEATRRLDRTRMLVRLGPILGLMGTLIPISPALVGLARGDVEALSSNLVIAFSTTVVGLLIGGVSFVITTVRERYYRGDVSELEYAFDLVEDAR